MATPAKRPAVALLIERIHDLADEMEDWRRKLDAAEEELTVHQDSALNAAIIGLMLRAEALAEARASALAVQAGPGRRHNRNPYPRGRENRPRKAS